MEDTLKESSFNLADPENYHLRCKKKVRWSDQDVTAHVNNVQFARFIETSRIVFLHGLASNVRDLTAFFMIARVEIDYLAEMRVPSKVRASTQIRTHFSSFWARNTQGRALYCGWTQCGSPY